MDLNYTAEDKLFREELREWLSRNVPREKPPEDRYSFREYDMAWQRTQFEGGWAGIAWPKEFGGRGLSLVEQMIWYEESARANSPGPGCAFVGLNHGGPTLIAMASEAQKAFHLPRILHGVDVWCQGFSEPGAGSDLAGLSTRGEIDGDELVINGSKIWTSYAQVADFQELLVRTDPDSRRHGGLTWIICDMKAPGITVRGLTMTNGSNSHVNQVFYDDVRLPLSNIVGEINSGWKVAMSTLSFERGTAFTERQMEIGKRIDALVEQAKTRTGPDGKPAHANDDIARQLSRLRAETAALRAMTFAAVARNQRRPMPGPDGSMLKLHLSRISKEAAQISRRLAGADAVMMTDVMYEHLGSFVASVGGGTDEIQHNIVAERVLGLPKSY
jgi:alkylation response protein AidB-like acyl-CoA dehydrogenase